MQNALIHETSPYLLQHAGNPVDWQAWGESAFARARAEGKMVFLSIGYSTCHWCHVMERESFENDRVAAVMNRNFVNVKVDREERPDIDATYMAFVQATTGHGGWPMSVWLTPDGKPVVGGTYFPPDDRDGRAGFMRLSQEVGRLWREDRGRLEASAARLMDQLRNESPVDTTLRGLPGPKVFGDFLDRCESLFDHQWGGFSSSPKFPRPAVLRALMQLGERFGREGEEGGMAWEMSERTLRAMASGGVRDHLAGGFHRYSVDRYWHVPHYEKMLYDQAQLAMAFLDGWQISKEAGFREVAEEIFSYLMNDLRDAGGAFHAAEDADSLESPDATVRSEGAYWTWRSAEIQTLLAPRDAAIFTAAYGVQEDGNARPESNPHGELEGRNTLFRAAPDSDLAASFACPEAAIRERLVASKSTLLKARGERPMPHRDDKIVTAWNGLAIGALARGARVFDRADLGEAARHAAEFIRQELWDGKILFRSFRGRRGAVAGFPADHVFLISGLIDLHGTFPAEGWGEWALEVQASLDAGFWDAERTGYVMRFQLGEETLRVIREDYDGAEPSPNHLAAENLLKLGDLFDRPDYRKRAEALLRAGSRMLETQPFAAPVLIAALDLRERGVMKFKIPDKAGDSSVARWRGGYFPRSVIASGSGNRVVVCEGTVCRLF